MKDVFTHRASQHGLTKENHAIGAFLPKTAPETLQMCVQIGRLRRQAHRRGARVALRLVLHGSLPALGRKLQSIVEGPYTPGPFSSQVALANTSPSIYYAW